MRGNRRWRLALGLVSFSVAAGCRSLPSPLPMLDGGLVSSPAITPQQERAAQAFALYSTGIHHELADEYEPAFEAYRRAAQLDPDSETIALRLASTLAFLRRTEEALRSVEEFVERHPASEDALMWLATFYGTAGEEERVLALFRQMTRQFPEQPRGWLQLAAATARGGDVEAVIQILEQGIRHAQPPTALRQELARIHLGRMRSAREASEQRQLRQSAIETLQDIGLELPGDTETLYVLGDLLVQDNQYAEAIAVYEKIERLQPTDLQVKQRLASTFLAMDDPEQAVAVLETLSRDPAGSSDIPYYLAELYQQAGDTEKAIQHFRKATETQPDNPAPWLKLAALYSDQSDDDAVAILEEALGAIPNDMRLKEVLALVYQNQRRYAEAAGLMQQIWDAIRADESDVEPSNLFHFHFATISTHLRRAPDAATWLRRAIDLEPALLDLYVQRAMAGTSRYRRTAASALGRLAREGGPETAAIHAHLGALFLAQNNPERAAREFNRVLAAVRRDPLQAGVLNPRFYFWFGVALDQAGQTDRAIEVFETCIEMDPEHADALNYVAYVWALRAERLDEALRLDPDNAAYIDTLGWIYYQQGRYEEALDQLLRADELRPDDPEIVEHIEKTLEKLGRDWPDRPEPEETP